LPQNFSSASIAVPQAAQARPSRWPHSVQKRRSGRLPCPHDGQGIAGFTSMTRSSRLASHKLVIPWRALCQTGAQAADSNRHYALRAEGEPFGRSRPQTVPR
jgi:hypothetical protein